MRQVAHVLWIGDSRDGRDHPAIGRAGLEALVDLALDEPPLSARRELAYLRFPLLDGAGNPPRLVEAAVRTVTTLLQLSVPTLVFCSGGMSRSPAIAAAALSIIERRPAPDCLARVIGTGPRDVSPGLWATVLKAIDHARRVGDP